MHADVLRKLLKDGVIKEGLVDGGNATREIEKQDFNTAVITLDREDDEQQENSSSFEISRGLVEQVKRRCIELDYPLTEGL